MTTILPNLKNLPYGGAEAVVDPGLNKFIHQTIHTAVNTDVLNDSTVHQRFLEQYRHWILSTKHNTITGLELFPVSVFSLGTTEAFDKFYLKNSQRRFRCFRGEYMYHQVSWRNYFQNWKFLDDEPISSSDAVVISLPFSDLGSEHPKMREVLDQCSEMGVPVLLDCAYFGICYNTTFDFTHPSITDITFSLSKFIPVAHLRIGMRLTRIDDDDSLLVINKTNYVNRLSAAVGIEILNNFSPDYNYIKYGALQLSLCEQLKVETSNCVIFGIDRNNQYPEYSRGRNTNRLCFSKHFNLK